jgi:hypothetical protein
MKSGKATIALFSSVLGMAFFACVEPPPRIAAIPPSGMALRLYVFGASAQEARRAFEAVKQNNKNFTLVNEGGDGDVVVGLENDSPKCVAPTGLCSFKLAFRVRDNQGTVLAATTTNVSANAERCADLCERALNSAVVKVVEAAASVLHVGTADADGGMLASDGGAWESDATSTDAASSAAAKPPKKSAPKNAKSESSKAEPIMCSVGRGPTLPAEEAEKRAAQVEALKRLGVIEQDEYDCLRKAYLERL